MLDRDRHMPDMEPTDSLSISIVIASGAGGEFLPRCLASLREQVAASSAELIVVDRRGGETASRIEREFPFAKLLRQVPDHQMSVPELRKIGVLAASGDIVAVIEEHCTVPPGWIESIRRGFAGDSVVATGGPILHADYQRTEDWVVYFSEYHNYLPPWPEGPRYLLNGANIAYRRERLLEHAGILGDGYWEVVLHPRLAAAGEFRAVPGMGAYHTGPFDYGYYLEQRYLLSRVWGGTQREKVGAGKRLLYLVAAPALPFLLLARIAHRVTGSPGLMPKFLHALPMLVPAAFAYVWGEWLGYLVGMGDALERVE